MISSADEYRFVDFAEGELPLPTGNIDGHPMPLRSGPAQGILKAEDVAFLVECVRDKLGAFRGMTSDGEAVYGSDPYPGKVALTRALSGRQMREKVRAPLANALARSFPFYGMGFLSRPLPSGHVFLEDENDDFNSHMDQVIRDVLRPGYGLSAAPTPAEARFNGGEPVVKEPVSQLFDDAKKLTRPVISMTPGLQSAFEVVEGTPPDPPVPVDAVRLGWEANNASSGDGTIFTWCGRWGLSDSRVLASIPDDYISGAELWLLYDAYDMVYCLDVPGGVPVNHLRRRVGLLKLSDLGLRGFKFYHVDGHWVCTSEPMGAYRIYQRIINDLGWREYRYNDVADAADVSGGGTAHVSRQFLSVTYSYSFIVTATPNGRTKWWSD